MLSWRDLRQSSVNVDLETGLANINDWWWRAPMVNRYLHWDDRRNWPSAWQLLSDNYFCDVARALGIMYTVMMLQRPDITEIELIHEDEVNLVHVNHGKYILNWAPGQLLNNQSREFSTRHRLSSAEIQHLIY